MEAIRKLKDFNNLDEYPDLKKAILPAIMSLPSGSINTKVIINDGEVVERIFETPKGEIISIFANKVSKDVA